MADEEFDRAAGAIREICQRRAGPRLAPDLCSSESPSVPRRRSSLDADGLGRDRVAQLHALGTTTPTPAAPSGSSTTSRSCGCAWRSASTRRPATSRSSSTTTPPGSRRRTPCCPPVRWSRRARRRAATWPGWPMEGEIHVLSDEWMERRAGGEDSLQRAARHRRAHVLPAGRWPPTTTRCRRCGPRGASSPTCAGRGWSRAPSQYFSGPGLALPPRRDHPPARGRPAEVPADAPRRDHPRRHHLRPARPPRRARGLRAARLAAAPGGRPRPTSSSPSRRHIREIEKAWRHHLDEILYPADASDAGAASALAGHRASAALRSAPREPTSTCTTSPAPSREPRPTSTPSSRTRSRASRGSGAGRPALADRETAPAPTSTSARAGVRLRGLSARRRGQQDESSAARRSRPRAAATRSPGVEPGRARP